MRWYDNLYVSELASHEKLKSFGRMRKRFSFNAYMITLPANDENLLDILRYSEIVSNPYYNDVMIIGIASGKSDAFELVRDIVWDTYRNTGNVRVRDYLGLNN